MSYAKYSSLAFQLNIIRLSTSSMHHSCSPASRVIQDRLLRVRLVSGRLFMSLSINTQLSTSNMACAASNVMSKRASAVEEWVLHRSAACDISVSVYEAWNERPAADSYNNIFQTIVLASPRLRRLSLVLSLESFRQFCDFFRDSTLPRLDFLDFRLAPNPDIGGSIQMFNASPLVAAVNLRQLCLSTGAANYGVYWSHITDISLGKDSAVSTTCVDSIFTLCPQVCSCTLYIELDSTVPRAFLPHL